MNEQSTYRLTGAVFILALAIILLPMLFDAEGLEPVRLDPLPAYGVERQSFDRIPKENLAPVQALRQRIDKQGFNTATGVRTGDPHFELPTGADSEVVKGWGVQLGSFTRESNAIALRDKLLEDNYHAVMSHVRVGEDISTRVAIGPIIEESEARKLLQELSSRYEEQSILVRFGY